MVVLYGLDEAERHGAEQQHAGGGDGAQSPAGRAAPNGEVHRGECRGGGAVFGAGGAWEIWSVRVVCDCLAYGL